MTGEDVRRTIEAFHEANPGIEARVREVAESLGPMSEATKQLWGQARTAYRASLIDQEAK